MATVRDHRQDRDLEESKRQRHQRDQSSGHTSIHGPSDSAGSSTPQVRGCGANTMCVTSESDIQRLDHEDGSSAHSSDDDSVEGDELGLCSNNLGLSVCFDNGSEVPRFGHVCVKDSSNVHFGATNIYNDGVTIRQIFYKDSRDQVPEEGDANLDCRNRKDETVNSTNTRVYHKVSVKKWLFCGIGTLLLLIAIVVCMILFMPKQDEPHELRMPLGPNGSWIITREGWRGRKGLESGINLELPVQLLIISETGTERCENLSDCTRCVRKIQSGTVGYSDIRWNFLIGGDGNVYEGRGWDHVGAHTQTYNEKSIGISFIGTFDTIKPRKRQLRAAQHLIDLGVKKKKLTNNYILAVRREIVGDENPGAALCNIIRTWLHYKRDVDYRVFSRLYRKVYKN